MFLLAIKLKPGASRRQVLGWYGEQLKLAVTAAPEKGRANAAAQELLAEILDLPKSAIHLQRGATSTQKLFSIERLDAAEIRRRIDQVLARN